MSLNILVVTEQSRGEFKKASFETISEARRIADKNGGKVAALVIGSDTNAFADVAAQYGADLVYAAADAALKNYQPEWYSQAVVKAVESFGANVVLLSATAQGKDLAPRAAVKLNAGLASDCLNLFVKNGSFEAERPMYAGKTFARVRVTSDIKVATLRPNLFEAAEPDASKSAPVEAIAVDTAGAKITMKELKLSEGTAIEITEADIIVTGGRGLKGPENFSLMEDLAKPLDAAVGATRAVVDAGWRSHAAQVGQTGKTVTPTLYMMFGASGAIQHWAGMSGSKCIVAVNKDPNAPIMEKADYSIVGDLFEVVPALIEEVKKVCG